MPAGQEAGATVAGIDFESNGTEESERASSTQPKLKGGMSCSSAGGRQIDAWLYMNSVHSADSACDLSDR